MGKRNPKSTYMLRVLAGGYLAYLAYGLVKGYMAGESTNPLFLLAGIAFAIIGIGLLVTAFKGLYLYKEPEEDDNEAEADEIETDEIQADEIEADEIKTDEIKADEIETK